MIEITKFTVVLCTVPRSEAPYYREYVVCGRVCGKEMVDRITGEHTLEK